MIIRIIHKQAQEVEGQEGETNLGPILISDIDQGLPNELLGEERKQACYLTYYHKRFVKGPNGSLRVEEDRTRPGFLDLVPSDKVRQSMASGTLKVLAEEGLLELVEIPTGTLVKPELEEASLEGGKVTISGTGLKSIEPDATIIRIGELTFVQGEEGVGVSEGEITITGVDLEAGTHKVEVLSNGQTSNTVEIDSISGNGDTGNGDTGDEGEGGDD